MRECPEDPGALTWALKMRSKPSHGRHVMRCHVAVGEYGDQSLVGVEFVFSSPGEAVIPPNRFSLGDCIGVEVLPRPRDRARCSALDGRKRGS
jgi:hypothetical protein